MSIINHKYGWWLGRNATLKSIEDKFPSKFEWNGAVGKIIEIAIELNVSSGMVIQNRHDSMDYGTFMKSIDIYIPVPTDKLPVGLASGIRQQTIEWGVTSFNMYYYDRESTQGARLRVKMPSSKGYACFSFMSYPRLDELRPRLNELLGVNNRN